MPLRLDELEKPAAHGLHPLEMPVGEVEELPRIDLGRRPQLRPDPQTLVPEHFGAGSGGVVAGWHSLVRDAADVVSRLLRRVDGAHECDTALRIGDGLSIFLQQLRVEHVEARAEHQRLCVKRPVVADGFTALRGTLPEPQVEVVLVGTLVLGESDVAVDPPDRAVDARFRADRWIELSQARAELAHERKRGLEQIALIVVAVRVEPILAVVLRQRRQEALRLFWESFEADRDRHGRESLPGIRARTARSG